MKNIKKIISIFTIGTMTALLLAGCGSKAAATSAAVNSNAKTDTAQQAPKSMETNYSNVLKELGANKAITQAQADKVLAAVKKSSDGTKPADGTKPTDAAKTKDAAKTTGGTKPAHGTKPNDSKLNALVTAGTITQAQADTINQKVQATMKSSQSK